MIDYVIIIGITVSTVLFAILARIFIKKNKVK